VAPVDPILLLESPSIYETTSVEKEATTIEKGFRPVALLKSTRNLQTISNKLPDNEKLNEIGSRYMPLIFGYLPPSYSVEMAMLPMNIPNFHKNIYFPWVRFPSASKSVQYATLALSCALNSKNTASRRNLERFRNHARDAIDRSLIYEVVVSSYVALLCSFRTCEPLDTLFMYFEGIRAGFLALMPKKPGDFVDMISYGNICSVMRSSFRTLLLAYLVRTEPGTKNAELRREVYSVLRRTTNNACRYSMNNLGILNVNGNEGIEVPEFISSLHWRHYLFFRKECTLDSGIPHSFEVSLREMMNWYRECRGLDFLV